MDWAGQILAQGTPPGVRNTYRARAEHSGVARSTLHARALGRRSKEQKAQSQQYLTPCEEKAVVNFLLQMAELGQAVRIKHIPSLAFSVARQRSTNKPPKPPGRNWARAFEKRHPELKARRNRALDWDRYNIYDKVVHWFEVIGKVLQDRTIVPENFYNMDETGIMLIMLGSAQVLVSKDNMRGHRGARVKRTVVTAIECISGDGRYLNPMIVWPASTHRANWTTYPTPGWYFAYSDSGYTDSVISLEWLKRVFDPQTKARAKEKPRMLIWDGFGTHETLEILEFCFENNIILYRLPSHTSHKLQPYDTAVFAPLKAAYRDQVERLERGGVGTIGKQHFTYLYSPVRERALTKRNILAGWKASGLYPFNPDKVLTDAPKPATKPTIPTLKTCKIDLYPQDDVLQTPVTSEALTSLHNLIKQDAYAEDKMSKQRL
jgi:DDE superfamily endonuclease/Tc5 transposase DNA-binding domain